MNDTPDQREFTSVENITAEIDGAYTLKSFCERFGIGPTKAYEEIGAKRLIARKSGKRTLITRESAVAWFNSLPQLVLNRKSAA